MKAEFAVVVGDRNLFQLSAIKIRLHERCGEGPPTGLALFTCIASQMFAV